MLIRSPLRGYGTINAVVDVLDGKSLETGELRWWIRLLRGRGGSCGRGWAGLLEGRGNGATRCLACGLWKGLDGTFPPIFRN